MHTDTLHVLRVQERDADGNAVTVERIHRNRHLSQRFRVTDQTRIAQTVREEPPGDLARVVANRTTYAEWEAGMKWPE